MISLYPSVTTKYCKKEFCCNWLQL